jgi:hypothetical protein
MDSGRSAGLGRNYSGDVVSLEHSLADTLVILLAKFSESATTNTNAAPATSICPKVLVPAFTRCA